MRSAQILVLLLLAKYCQAFITTSADRVSFSSTVYERVPNSFAALSAPEAQLWYFLSPKVGTRKRIHFTARQAFQGDILAIQKYHKSESITGSIHRFCLMNKASFGLLCSELNKLPRIFKVRLRKYSSVSSSSISPSLNCFVIFPKTYLNSQHAPPQSVCKLWMTFLSLNLLSTRGPEAQLHAYRTRLKQDER